MLTMGTSGTLEASSPAERQVSHAGSGLDTNCSLMTKGNGRLQRGPEAMSACSGQWCSAMIS